MPGLPSRPGFMDIDFDPKAGKLSDWLERKGQTAGSTNNRTLGSGTLFALAKCLVDPLSASQSCKARELG
jgi:hypothetical protein